MKKFHQVPYSETVQVKTPVALSSVFSLIRLVKPWGNLKTARPSVHHPVACWRNKSVDILPISQKPTGEKNDKIMPRKISRWWLLRVRVTVSPCVGFWSWEPAYRIVKRDRCYTLDWRYFRKLNNQCFPVSAQVTSIKNRRGHRAIYSRFMVPFVPMHATPSARLFKDLKELTSLSMLERCPSFYQWKANECGTI